MQTQQTGHDRLVSFAEFSKKQYKFGFQVRKSEALHDYLMQGYLKNQTKSSEQMHIEFLFVQTQQTGHDRLVSFAEFSKKRHKKVEKMNIVNEKVDYLH